MAQNSSDEETYLESIYNLPFLYKGRVFTKRVTTPEILQKCEQFEFRSDDVIIATYPRTGTTVTDEIVWHVVNHEKVEKDGQYGLFMPRFPYLEFNLKGQDETYTTNPIDSLPSQSGKRIIQTHLPYSFIRDQVEKVQPKIIVVMRNPKDNVVSCYPFFCGRKFLKEGVPFSDYFQAYMSGHLFGDVRDFNLEYWSLRDRNNVLMVRYEDIVQQPFQEVRKIALFLGYSLTVEKLAAIVHNTTFSVMSKNDQVNFTLNTGVHKNLRQGKSGDWKNKLTVAQSEAMDCWMAERMSGSGLQFTYD